MDKVGSPTSDSKSAEARKRRKTLSQVAKQKTSKKEVSSSKLNTKSLDIKSYPSSTPLADITSVTLNQLNSENQSLENKTNPSVNQQNRISQLNLRPRKYVSGVNLLNKFASASTNGPEPTTYPTPVSGLKTTTPVFTNVKRKLPRSLQPQQQIPRPNATPLQRIQSNQTQTHSTNVGNPQFQTSRSIYAKQVNHSRANVKPIPLSQLVTEYNPEFNRIPSNVKFSRSMYSDPGASTSTNPHAGILREIRTANVCDLSTAPNQNTAKRNKHVSKENIPQTYYNPFASILNGIPLNPFSMPARIPSPDGETCKEPTKTNGKGQSNRTKRKAFTTDAQYYAANGIHEPNATNPVDNLSDSSSDESESDDSQQSDSDSESEQDQSEHIENYAQGTYHLNPNYLLIIKYTYTSSQ
jgi:hypothetical protein